MAISQIKTTDSSSIRTALNLYTQPVVRVIWKTLVGSEIIDQIDQHGSSADRIEDILEILWRISDLQDIDMDVCY